MRLLGAGLREQRKTCTYGSVSGEVEGCTGEDNGFLMPIT